MVSFKGVVADEERDGDYTGQLLHSFYEDQTKAGHRPLEDPYYSFSLGVTEQNSRT